MGPSDDKREHIGRTGEFAFQKKSIDAGKANFQVDGVASNAQPTADSKVGDIARIPTTPDYYPPPTKFRAELKKAETVFAAFTAAVTQMIRDLRVGLPLRVTAVAPILDSMLESIVRHPDPMVWMTRLQVPDSYLIRRSLRCAVLASVLARDMGMAEPQLKRVAWGGLLCQIGKTKLPRKLLEKPGPLSPDELARVRTFVNLGADLLRACPDVDAAVIDIVQHHHERFDSSGYPNALAGDRIPLLARLVGVADWYNAMTGKKPYTHLILSSTDAMDELNRLRDVLFQGQIAEEFIKAIGLYPNGSLVELNSGEVALVMVQNPQNRTQPEVLLVLNERKQARKRYDALDLLAFNQTRKGHPKTIKRALASGEFNLDANSIMQSSAQQKAGWRKFVPGA